MIDKLDDRPLKFYPEAKCLGCKHLISPLRRECKAFKVIPDDIWTGRIQHDKVFEGQDKPLVFERFDK